MLKRYCYLAFYFLWYQVQKNGCRNVRSRRLHISFVCHSHYILRGMFEKHCITCDDAIFFVCTVCTRTLRSLLESGSMSHKNTQTHTSSMVLCLLPGSQIMTHKTFVFHSNVNATLRKRKMYFRYWHLSHVFKRQYFDPLLFTCSDKEHVQWSVHIHV